MPEYFIVELFEGHSQFFVLFPDLCLVHLIIVGDFGHMLVVLGIAFNRVAGDVGQIGATGGTFVPSGGVHFATDY